MSRPTSSRPTSSGPTSSGRTSSGPTSSRPTSTRSRDSATTPSRLDRAAAVALVVVVVGCAVMLAFFAALLVPLRAGTVLIPIAIPIALGAVWFAPKVLELGGIPYVARFLPWVAWLATTYLLGAGSSEGDRLLPAGGGLSTISYVVLLGGAVLGPVAVMLPELRVKSRA
ncbi:MAG: hypothetical protein JWN61_110 [Pseudonocardiales bacterium]|nr:hypothetical protein [Jatrophihabitantaceae bacterium]MCW2601975.1 hypothetical protein [Pseudonocardiales bacterium]